MKPTLQQKLILIIPFTISAMISIMMIMATSIVWWDISPVLAIIFCILAIMGTLFALYVAYVYAEESAKL